MPSSLIPSPKEIKNYLDYYVIGQEQAKQDMAILGYAHYMRFYKDLYLPNINTIARPPKLSGLLTGPSGCGKTYLSIKLAEYLELPYLIVDATALSVSGFKGVSIYDLFCNYYQRYKATEKIDIISRGILYIDEIDKIGGNLQTTNSGNWMQKLQESLLTIIDGSKFNLKDERGWGPEINTETMLIILSGSFMAINRARALESRGIGFKSDHDEFAQNLTSPATREELENHGMIPEFVGRIHVISYVNQLTKNDIKRIIVDCSDSTLAQFQALFFLSGVKLELTDSQIDMLAEKAYKSNYGARFIKQIVFEYIKAQMFDLEPDVAEVEKTILEYEQSLETLGNPLDLSDDGYNPVVGFGDKK